MGVPEDIWVGIPDDWRLEVYQPLRLVLCTLKYEKLLTVADTKGAVEMLNYQITAHGFFTPPAVAPGYNNSRTGTTSLSLSAGAVWGTGTVPSFILSGYLVFHFIAKGILQSR